MGNTKCGKCKGCKVYNGTNGNGYQPCSGYKAEKPKIPPPPAPPPTTPVNPKGMCVPKYPKPPEIIKGPELSYSQGEQPIKVSVEPNKFGSILRKIVFGFLCVYLLFIMWGFGYWLIFWHRH